MRRGTITLLLLALVALTLQQEGQNYQCTCQQNAGTSVMDKASQYNPLPTVNDGLIDLNVRPSDGASVSQDTSNWGVVSLNDNILVNGNTSYFQNLLNQANQNYNQSNQLVTNLNQTQAQWNQERNLVKLGLERFLNDTDRLATIFDPLTAVQHVVRVLYISNTLRLINRVDTWFRVNIQFNQYLTNLYAQQVQTFQQALNVSQRLDNNSTNATVAARVTALTALLLTSPNLLTNLGTNVQGLNTGVTTYQDQLAAALNDDAFQSDTQDALNQMDDMDRAHLFEIWARCENTDYPRFDEVRAGLNNITDSNYVNRFHQLVAALLYGYQLGNTSTWSCDGSNDQSNITCTYIAYISEDADNGADRLKNALRVLVLAATGSLQINSDLDSVSVGTATINVYVSRYEFEPLRNVFEDADVAQRANSSVTETVNAKLNEYKAKLEAGKDQVEKGANDTIQLFITQVRQVQNYTETVQNALQARVAVAVALVSARLEAARQIVAGLNDSSAAANNALTQYISRKRQDLDDRAAAAQSYLRAFVEADAVVFSSARDMLQAKLQSLNAQANETVQTIYNRSKDALQESVQQALTIREKANNVYAALNDSLTEAEGQYNTAKAQLQDNVYLLQNNSQKEISDARTQFQAATTDYAQRIKDIIRGYRDTINDVVVAFTNLNVAGSTDIRVRITIYDDGLQGEADAARRAIHRAAVRAALILCSANRLVVVADVNASAKRATGDSYDATVGSSSTPSTPGTPSTPSNPAGTPTTPSTPTAPTTNGNPTSPTGRSSASSVALSFAILLACVLFYLF